MVLLEQTVANHCIPQLDMRRRFRGNHLSDKEAKSSRGSGVIGIADVGPETKGEK